MGAPPGAMGAMAEVPTPNILDLAAAPGLNERQRRNTITIKRRTSLLGLPL